MNAEEKRIHAAITAANPLLDECFCDEVRKSYLLYDDERLPRRIANMRLAAEIWEAKGQAFGLLSCVDEIVGPEPSFQALLADAQALLERNDLPSWYMARRLAEKCLPLLYDRRVKEMGIEQVHRALRREYLLAVEQLAKAGFTGGAVDALTRIFGLSRIVAKPRR